MKYSEEEVLQYVQEDDVKFIRITFCDVFGRQKNISIMPNELPRAFAQGIPIDASQVAGFGDELHSDLLLHPQADTLHQLPWRPEHGKVVRLYSDITWPDGSPFSCDTRRILKEAIADAEKEGIRFFFGTKQDFYLLLLNENGYPTNTPYDRAGYMDLAPYDRGENIRREICLTLEQLGIQPESSHHEAGPGQNKINFHYSDALPAADNVMTFRTVVGSIAYRNGLFADFRPKPFAGQPGNGFHIVLSVESADGRDLLAPVLAGILAKTKEMTAFFNPSDNSYERLGEFGAPGYISWSKENRSPLIRIPGSPGNPRAEFRSPDPSANPYLAFALLIRAGLYGIKNGLTLPPSADLNLYTADEETLSHFVPLPGTIADAKEEAAKSAFIKEIIPPDLLRICCGQK